MYVDEINNELDRLLPMDNYPNFLCDAMRYSVFPGGKRLRPTLFLASFDLFSPSSNHFIALPLACAIEFIHSYSLIHDDLPAMDNDDFRRGKLSCHKAFGEATAILAGDALLNLAFHVMCEQAVKCSDLNVISTIKLICSAAGHEGMIGGQATDISFAGKPVEKDTLLFIHEHKTGALINAALAGGAVLANAPHEKIAIILKASEALGLAFQIKDDLLDLQSDNSNNSNDKNVNYALYFGVDTANKQLSSLTSDAITCFKELSCDDDSFLIKLAKDLMIRNS